jgi:hypothetical protein
MLEFKIIYSVGLPKPHPAVSGACCGGTVQRVPYCVVDQPFLRTRGHLSPNPTGSSRHAGPEESAGIDNGTQEIDFRRQGFAVE